MEFQLFPFLLLFLSACWSRDRVRATSLLPTIVLFPTSGIRASGEGRRSNNDRGNWRCGPEGDSWGERQDRVPNAHQDQLFRLGTSHEGQTQSPAPLDRYWERGRQTPRGHASSRRALQCRAARNVAGNCGQGDHKGSLGGYRHHADRRWSREEDVSSEFAAAVRLGGSSTRRRSKTGSRLRTMHYA